VTRVASAIFALVLAFVEGEPSQMPLSCHPSLEEVLSNVKAASEKVKDLRAEFVQEKIMTVLDESEKSTGQAFYRFPDLLVLHHEKPEEVTMWIKGREVLVYEKEIDQLRKYSLSEEDRDLTFLAARLDTKALEKRFALSLKKAFRKEEEDFFIVELTPTSEELRADIDRVEAEVSGRSWLVRRISIYETNRDITNITFSKVRLNTGLSGDDVIPEVPEGKRVIDLSE